MGGLAHARRDCPRYHIVLLGAGDAYASVMDRLRGRGKLLYAIVSVPYSPSPVVSLPCFLTRQINPLVYWIVLIPGSFVQGS